jgi:hypothetical protein
MRCGDFKDPFGRFGRGTGFKARGGDHRNEISKNCAHGAKSADPGPTGLPPPRLSFQEKAASLLGARFCQLKLPTAQSLLNRLAACINCIGTLQRIHSVALFVMVTVPHPTSARATQQQCHFQRVFPTIPPRVDYELTKLGHS